MSSRVGSLRHRSRDRSPPSCSRPALPPSPPSHALLPTPSAASLHPKALYLSYPHPISLPTDAVFSSIFRRYGVIERLFAHRTPRVYVIVEYTDAAAAAHALRELYLHDSSGDRRAELGDPRLSISFKTEKVRIGAEVRKPFWSGQLSLSGQSPVLVTAARVEGDCVTVLASTLTHVSISHRAPVTEVLTKDTEGVVLFTGVDDGSRQALGDLAAYFYFKQRAGFLQLQKYDMYVLPPGPEAVRFVASMEADQLVGVLVHNH